MDKAKNGLFTISS